MNDGLVVKAFNSESTDGRFAPYLQQFSSGIHEYSNGFHHTMQLKTEYIKLYFASTLLTFLINELSYDY